MNERREPFPRRLRGGRRHWLLIGAIASAVAAAVVSAVAVVGREAPPGVEFPSQGNAHIASIDAPHPAYNSDPPSSGWHVGGLASWGGYDYELPDELLLHNLEDGGVILYYPLGAPAENQRHLADLRDVASGFQRVVIAPRDRMEATYALVAWQRIARFDAIDREGMRRFLTAYEGVDRH